MQRLTYVVFINLAHYYAYGKRSCKPCTWSCTSLVPRPMIVVFGLGARLHVCMHKTLENGILRNGQ